MRRQTHFILLGAVNNPLLAWLIIAKFSPYCIFVSLSDTYATPMLGMCKKVELSVEKYVQFDQFHSLHLSASSADEFYRLPSNWLLFNDV